MWVVFDDRGGASIASGPRLDRGIFPSWKQAAKEIALQWRRSVATDMARFERVQVQGWWRRCKGRQAIHLLEGELAPLKDRFGQSVTRVRPPRAGYGTTAGHGVHQHGSLGLGLGFGFQLLCVLCLEQRLRCRCRPRTPSVSSLSVSWARLPPPPIAYI